jgi:hypothetical protein
MKRSSSIVLAFLFTFASGAFAADKAGEKPRGKPANVTKSDKVVTAGKPARQVALTGSYIKRPVRRDGLVTEGSNPVVVLDSEAIRNSGAADLREVLLFRGLSR